MATLTQPRTKVNRDRRHKAKSAHAAVPDARKADRRLAALATAVGVAADDRVRVRAESERVLPEVASLQHDLSISQAELARVSGFSVRSIASWQAGRPLSDPAKLKMVELRRLQRALGVLMSRGELGEWMRMPNDSFLGQTPLQLLERGEADRLWRMLYEVQANVAT